MNTAIQGPLTTREAAKYLGLSWESMRVWRYQGKGPRYVKYCNRAIRYRIEDLDAFMEAHLVDPGADSE